MTRYLVVCCDGTWNTPEQEQAGVPIPTNVVRLYNALAETDTQLRYYHPGVGTGAGMVDHVVGGGVGTGLSLNVMSAYAWLAATYEPGDAVCLFGFSRGAYTARSVAGMIGHCGLPRISETDPERWTTIERLYRDRYRAGAPMLPDPPHVRFLGVWDTVGALGIPESLGLVRAGADLLGLVPRFHNTSLGHYVDHARHAVALDERRGPFVPTLWNNVDVEAPRTAKQVWFPGNHCDVGGGHLQTGLSDGALQWMIEEFRAACPDIVFHDQLLSQIDPNPCDVLHDDATGLYALLAPTPRAAPYLSADRPDPDRIDAAALHRQRNFPITTGPYRSGCALEYGDSATATVWAVHPWNWTGIYLDKGDYELVATGEWLDGTTAYSPAGAQEGIHLPNLMHRLGDAVGAMQHLLRPASRDQALTLLGALRLPGKPWMSLIACVAATRLDDNGGQLPYEQIVVGDGPTRFLVRAPGYLYAYANDAWGLYGNNRGSVTLTVSRPMT